MKTEKKYASVFELNGVPKLTQAFPLALQHVVAMIVGCVTPAIVIAEMAGLNEGDKVIFVQAALFIAAVSTLIQLFPLGGRIGSGLPVIMGVSFAYLPSMQAIVGNFDIATILGAQLIGGVVAIFVGIFVTKLRKLFPPLITGTVVFTIGLSLYPTAVKYMAGGQSSPNYGAWQNWLVAFLTLAVVVALNHFAKGILKLASILIGMIVGYIISGFFGMIDFSAVQGAGIFQIPRPMYFGMKFETSAVMTLVILFIINSVQAIGDLSATSGEDWTENLQTRSFQGNHWIWNYEYFRFFLWRVANCDVQPECWNRGNNEGSKPCSVRTCSRDYPAGRICSKVLGASYNDSAVCTWRSDHFGICVHRHDRNQVSGTAAADLSQYFDRRTFGCTRYGNHTVFGCAGTASSMGHNSIWKISGCCDNDCCNLAECDLAER